LAEVFTEYRAEVRTVGSSSEAIAVLTHGEWLPDVLISDIGMPEEDGYALLRRIRALPIEQGRNLPAIALTAYSRLEDRMQALEAGFQMYLAKPVEPLELALTVASLIEQQELAASQVIETRREKA
jgi:CheY-like chemotaxis protein